MQAVKANLELDAQVGTEVMGYSIVTWEEFEDEKLDTSKSYLVVADGQLFRLFNFNVRDGYEWSPSRDIDDAFSVQERIKELGLENSYSHALHHLTAKEAQQAACSYWWFLITATPEQRSIAALEAVRSTK